nr:hypothetical protein [Dechloromonas sp.]
MSSNTSTGQILGYVVGAVVGYFTGGVGYVAMGAALGGAAGALLDPPKGPKIVGPRLSDLSQQGASYGAPIPRVYGSVALLGNIFWIENNQLRERSKTESAGGKGGGGGAETTTYTYTATFAVGLCKGPIVGVRRIWIMGNLIYDAGSADLSTLIVSGAAAKGWRLYTGTETQMPDPRMQAALGAANCPAYRGLAYIVFEDLELADYGNTLMGAQIKVEVLSASDELPISLLAATPLSGSAESLKATALNCSDDGTLHVYRALTPLAVPGVVEQIDFGTSAAVEAKIGGIIDSIGGGFVQGWSDRNEIVLLDGAGNLVFSPNAGHPVASMPSYYAALNGFLGFNFHRRGQIALLCAEEMSRSHIVDISGTAEELLFTTDAASLDGQIHDIFIGQNRYYAVTLVPKVVCYDRNWVRQWAVDLTGEFTLSSGIGGTDAVVRESFDGECVVRHYNKFWYVTAAGFDYIGSVAPAIDSYESLGGDHLLWPIWIRYDAGLNEVFTIQLSGVANKTLSLGQIVAEECRLSNILSPSDIDTSNLTDAVRGYRVASTAAIRAALDPLQGAWPFDVVPDGYKIRFHRRGVAPSVATIEAAELDAREPGAQPGARLTDVREMDTQLPCRVSISFLDFEREYDVGEQYAERLNTDSVNVMSIDMPIVMTATEAARRADVLLYMYWLERNKVQLTLPPTFKALQPADIITVNDYGRSYDLRITQVSEANERLEIQATYADNARYDSTLQGATSSVSAAPLTIPGAALGFPLDIPLLGAGYDRPGFPVALTGYFPSWNGGVLYRSDDAGQTWTGVAAAGPGVVAGYAVNALGAPQDARLIDSAGRLTVRLYSGDLYSISEGQMLNGANHFAYGRDGAWEIVAARTCSQQPDGSYYLTDLLRGRFGTEWAMAGHNAGDVIVLLDANALVFVEQSLNNIGLSRTWKAVTYGYKIDDAYAIDYAYTGVNLECLSPVWINGDRHATTNDWTLTWVRRTRVGGEWRDNVDATLGEAAERYDVELYTDATYTTVKRTFAGLISPTVTYTTTQQIADFGAVQATLYLRVYQVSADVGRGYPLEYSILRAWSPFDIITTDGPVVFMKLDDASGATCVDEIGADGAIVGTDYTRGAAAIGAFADSTALTVQASDTRIVSTNYNMYPEFTVAVFFDVDAVSGVQTLVSKSSYFASATTDFPFALLINADGSLSAKIDSGNDYSTDQILTTAAGLVAALTPHHAAYVHRDNGLCEIYLDGVQVASVTIAFAMATGSRYWTWGAPALPYGGGAGTQGFKGRMAGATLFDHALSADRIAAHATLKN